MPDLSVEPLESLAESEGLTVVDYYPDTIFEYTFRVSGDLEFVDPSGRWRRARGCSADPETGIWFFEENLNEIENLVTLLIEALPSETTLEQLYQTNQRFQYLVNSSLASTGIEQKWFSPRMLVWMFFDRIEGGVQVRAALRVLNRLPAGKYSTGKGQPIEGRAEWMAMIATYAGGDLARAHELARAVEARCMVAEMDALGYFSMDAKERHQRDVAIWAENERRGRIAGETTQAPSPSPEASGNADLPRPKTRAVVPGVTNG